MAVMVDIGIVLGTALLMEALAWAAHRYIMHGFGWGWHRSHHEAHGGWFEINDLYAVIFALFAMGLFIVGAPVSPALFYVGLGVTVYGLAYVLVHDGLVHQRWPFRHHPKNRYLRRLVQAHRLHHAVEGRADCVSFGFLYAPPVRALKTRLVRLHPRGLRGEPAE